MNSERVFEWQLGNWLALPSWATWALLTLVAIAGAGLAAWLYRHTLRALTLRQRAIFVALRTGFFLTLLLCLAGPSRVKRIYNSTQESRPLAVLLDRSASMATPDVRGFTRLASALRIWKKMEDKAKGAFPMLRYFKFSSSVTGAPDLADAAGSPESGDQTRLFDSLEQLMKNAPRGGYGGIVTLTDGLDTTDAIFDQCVAQSLQDHCPLYFCAGGGKGMQRESLFVREFDVPGQVLRQSQFNARVVVEAHSNQERDVPISISVQGRDVADIRVHLHAGANLIPWTVPINSGEPGILPLECRLGEGPEAKKIAAAVHIVAQEQTHILFYQGSLDWTYRFINQAVQDDASFAMTGLFSQDIEITREISSSPNDPVFNQMPDKAEDLKPFQIVVLSNVFADQMSPTQQTALVNYVRGGGGVLFLVSDDKTAGTFVGTTLETMMPVVFDLPSQSDSQAELEQNFQDQMNQEAGPDGEDASYIKRLQSFAFPSGLKRSAIAGLFGAASGGLMQNVPQFSTYARVHGIKPGAEVLAVHPVDKTRENVPRALVVTQRFGQGHVTAMLTDGLWRWKMSLPSTCHDPELFWQQLFHTLAQQQSVHENLRFSRQPFFSAKDQISNFQLAGSPASNPPLITAISPAGMSEPLSPQLDLDGKSWNFQVKADQTGDWRIHAEDSRGAQMETWLRVSEASGRQELSGLPPDTDGLRRLAASTGGSLLDDGVPAGWSQSHTPNAATLVSTHLEPLWDTWILLLFALGFYVTELIWRRFAKLL